MTSPLNIDLLSQPSEQLYAAIEELLRTDAGGSEQAALENLLCGVLADPSATSFARSTAAYLAGKLCLPSALPILAANFGADWMGAKGGFAPHRCNPDTALLMYGKQALPALKEILKKSDQVEHVHMAALVLNNILGDKNAARQFLLDAKENGDTNANRAIDVVVAAMENWGRPA